MQRITLAERIAGGVVGSAIGAVGWCVGADRSRMLTRPLGAG
jgi:hypothetical protein